ncbi:uncharacterized protein LOC135703741 isoform X2 [Ochlerotatus camptorhynchus]|uniref:uncharacterized protein LOC135703741 isoform X2 n=1 Tax=Ochlerotatus camptorhynchus TaxID=644619 RepID=UPI0031D6E7C2
MDSMIMSLEESRRTQRPYRYGMILLCVGALVNWLGLAQDYTEPIRYTGVACILAGACLICTAMCCWLHTPNRAGSSTENDDPIHVISAAEERRCEKPPDYDSVAVAPPSYDDAIKLDPSALLQHTTTMVPATANCSSTVATPNATSATAAITSTSSTSSSTFNFSTILGLPRETRNASSASLDAAATSRSTTATVPSPVCLSIEHEKPPPYEASRATTHPPAIVAAIPIHMNPAIMVPGSN